MMANPSADQGQEIASVGINRSRYDPVSSDFLRKLFKQFLVKIGCSQCLELVVQSSANNRLVHCCARNKLLIKRSKTIGAPWQTVRCDVTVDYLNEVRQCEGACVGEDACTRAHNEAELVVWKEARAMGVSLERFFTDVVTSRLYPEVALQYWTRDRGVEVALLCRQCVQLGQGDRATKAKHKPFCKGDHDWSLAAACFTLTGTDGQARRYFADDEIPSDSHSDALQFSAFINEIKKFGLSDKDVVSTVTKIKQQAEKKVKREEARQAISEAEADVSVGVLDNDDLEVGDSLFSPPHEYDEDGSDCEGDSEQVDPEDLYYDMLPLSEALRKRDDQPDVFKRCRIKLDGIYDATATPIDEDVLPIKLRGRMNCGPCFNGDEVIVEIKHVQKLDLDSHTADPRLANANSSSDAVEYFNKDTHVRHGKVVAIVKKIQRRKGSVFVCTVDEYQSNLVKPLCATVPKIHLVDAVVRQKFGREAKDGYVALYKLREFGNLQPKKIVRLNEKDRQDKLFVVNVLKWSRIHMYPLGYAIKYLPEGTDAVSSERVARCACHVPPSYSPGDLRLLQPNFGLGLDTWRQGREDKRHELVVSIDPPDCRDVDDALSVRFDGHFYEVGVHIADVSCLVDKGGRLDTEALQRGVTFYPRTGHKPVHMFPTEFAENYCSLLPYRDRPCISVTFAVDQNDGKIVRSSIVRSIIHNKHKFTYDQVQSIIFSRHLSSAAGNETISDELRTALQQLHVAAKALRQARLGASRHYVQFEELLSTAGCEGSFAAHFLVEEFMIVANKLVAEKLVGAFPDCIPLRKQGRPDCEEFEEWFVSHSHSLHISSFFQQYVPVLQEIIPNVHSVPSSQLTSVPLLKEVAELLQGAVKQGDVEKVREILGAEDYHPLHATALEAWRSIQRSAEYVCSGDAGDRQHFSLGCNLYTHFTSPIRRYIDIVVHRLLLAALRGSKSCPYSPAEISAICEKINRASACAKKYDKFSTTVAAAESLRAVAAFKPSILVNIDENSLCFNFPGTPVLKRSQRSITFSNLDVCDKPHHPTIASKDPSRADKQDLEKMIFKWSRRIYDVNHLSQVGRLKSEARRSDALLHLLRDIHVRRVSLNDWKQVREAMDGENDSALLEHVGNMLQSVEWNPDCREVSSEIKDSKIVNHHVRFDLELQRTTVMQVQLAADSVNGILQPVITQLSLTPQYSICVQHMDDAIKCFANVATETLKEQYTSLAEYQRIWRPIIAMEAAYAAVQQADPVTIRNVPVCLQQTSPNSNKYCGHITLDIGFCKERCINLLRNSKDAEEDMHDYLCLKFSWSPANCTQHMHNLTTSHTWTCHALAVHGAVAGESDSENGSINDERTSGLFTVHFDVHHFSTPPPTQMLDTPGVKCTVELLAKPLPHRRMDEAVGKLSNAYKLCEHIVLGHHFDVALPDVKIPEDLNITPRVYNTYLPKNNFDQTEAIKKSLTQSFTLVQGPPGTGKTVTAIKIAYWFAQLNAKSEAGASKRQVLYCGPSNSAVDVALNFMKDYLGDKCPRILRVYSEMLERQIFPIPRDCNSEKQQQGRRYALYGKDYLADVSLHHLIRKPDNKFSKRLKRFDDLFRKNLNTPENIEQDKIEAYKKLVTDASMAEIAKYDVILCTCAVSASNRLIRAANIVQVIVDECGMCMEPEVLIPLVSFKPRQVVLVGDHRQLRPIVLCSKARRLGMERSLFERWAGLANNNNKHNQKLFVMLSKQYRMHPAICEFPSKQFYDGRLKSADHSSEWEGGRVINVWRHKACPLVFCHVEGVEKSQTVSTAEGNEQSKSNEQEKHHAVRIYRTLVNEHRVNYKSIAILSQYKAQCAEIRKELRATGMHDVDNVHVDSVVASQGTEFDYVILSTVRSLIREEIEKRPSIGWLHKQLGFIIDCNQINVALTRAKKGLIIIGNKYLLQADNMWRELLWAYDRRNCLLDANDFPWKVRKGVYMADDTIVRFERKFDLEKLPSLYQQEQQQYSRRRPK